MQIKGWYLLTKSMNYMPKNDHFVDWDNQSCVADADDAQHWIEEDGEKENIKKWWPWIDQLSMNNTQK